MHSVFKWFKRLCVAIVLGGMCFIGYYFYLFGNDPFNEWWFDAQIWKAQHNSAAQDNPRGKMVYDLKNRVLHREMTKERVLQILGPPDSKEGETSISYNIGAWSGFRMDMDIFEIEFDKSNKVTKIYWFQT